MSKATINDVADYVGVSKKTVSRVLNNEPNVSSKTQQKIQAAFDALNYSPSTQARGLASNKSFLIGLIYDNPNKNYVSDIQTGALEICNKEGYHLLIHPTDHESEDLLTNIQSMLNHSLLDGLILTPPFSDMSNLLSMLEAVDVPLVRIGSTNEHISGCVISNEEQASYDMTQHLISLGHTSIGFIKGHPHHNVSKLRFVGYKKALKANGISFDHQYVEEGDFDYRSGELCARKLLALEKPPSAIFASNDYMAAGVLKVASQKNISVPHQLSVTGFDDTPISRHIWPSMTTVKQPIIQMARLGLEMLIKIIQKQSIESMILEVNNTLIIRESSAPLQQNRNSDD
jgi:LacI family transcriptional regulator